MSDDKTKISVDIYGMQYKLSGHSSSNHMRRVAQLVDEQMHRIARGFPKLDTQRVAVLASVNIADEMLKQREQLEESRAGLQNNMAEEHRNLLEKYEQLQQEHAAVQAELAGAGKREADLQQQLDQLRNEYTKLQTEYNEWIQLVQNDQEK